MCVCVCVCVCIYIYIYKIKLNCPLILHCFLFIMGTTAAWGLQSWNHAKRNTEPFAAGSRDQRSPLLFSRGLKL